MTSPPEGAKPARIPKLSSSVHDINAEKPPFGSRFLTQDSDVWAQNAWDHVPPPEDQTETITASLARQRLVPIPDDDKKIYNEKPAKHWFFFSSDFALFTLTPSIDRDNFYKTNADNFFRNRKWLHLEFPELLAAAEPNAGDITICEIGCGAGNAAFPLLTANKNPNLMIRAYDYSTHAVKLVQTNALYSSPPVGKIEAAVWDLSSLEKLPQGVEPGTVDIIVLVFVLSALHPDEWGKAIANIHKILKPGGLVLFRDYGRHDLTQLRFKSGRLLEDNFYIRGDKTRVYFFELDELALIFTGSRTSPAQKTSTMTEVVDEDEDNEATSLPVPSQIASPASHTPAETPIPGSDDTLDLASSGPSLFPSSVVHPNLLHPLTHCPPHPLFTIEQLGVDRRLLVNRKRQLKMYRIWMQGKFRKAE
ncbi:S-adenosyl-L-methionine-dependent methyltransferase [Suillus clintonianus]|uniref:S-adenosyl-L-methionine-dependent methyltransferase n=1 Tax=Suillus clintonianus TaxID=1904413 RepID=UPI001B880E26|nr:S-adenosyl-L-methionine-dependent methyltransferase [Suillus clintonianus]KAG2141935.1 S-adenosyl-L-methionine-dependent methyltransferase [Suillus clintonianus]